MKCKGIVFIFITALITSIFPTYVDMSNEEFVRTMVAALNIRNLCIRLTQEVAKEIDPNQFSFGDGRFDSPCPLYSDSKTQQGLAIVFKRGIPTNLMTPLGNIALIVGGFNHHKWYEIQLKLKNFMLGHIISSQIEDLNHEIFAIDEFDGNRFLLVVLEENNRSRYDNIWQEFLLYCNQTAVLRDPWILNYYLYYISIERRDLSSSDQRMVTRAAEREISLINHIKNHEKEYWRVTSFPCMYGHVVCETDCIGGHLYIYVPTHFK